MPDETKITHMAILHQAEQASEIAEAMARAAVFKHRGNQYAALEKLPRKIELTRTDFGLLIETEHATWLVPADGTLRANDVIGRLMHPGWETPHEAGWC